VSQGKYNPLLGIKDAPDQPYRLYKDRSWLLVRVSREDHDQALTQDTSAKAAQFLEQLSKDKNAAIHYLEALPKAIEDARNAHAKGSKP
ncbi:hypothetical protein, partial [Ectopseudomonas mendocina]